MNMDVASEILVLEKRIDALEVELREFNNWALKRIADLEDCMKLIIRPVPRQKLD
jgi:uncharacterized protein with PhoU and TrkA domain